MMFTAAGFGPMFVPLTLTGTSGVDPADAGAAASLLNIGQQADGAIGLASLGTVVWTVAASTLQQQAATAGHVRLATQQGPCHDR